MKRIILCADDYGQNSAISQAIIDLISQKRLSAVSCLTTSYFWKEHGNWLQPFRDTVQLGLHFNLTEGNLLTSKVSFTSLPQLIVKAALRKLNQKAIEEECHAQIDQFVSVMGRLPQFIDGHQHIHQFPIIGDALLNTYEKRLRGTGAYIRSVFENIKLTRKDAYLKKFIIQLSGAAFREKLIRNRVPHNPSFAGIYRFANCNNYPSFFQAFLRKITDGGLIMCHPGRENSDSSDPISKARLCEYQYFLSDRFVRACFSERITLKS